MRMPYEEERGYYAQGQEESLNEYMTRTFLWMVLGLMITFGLAVLGWMTNATLWLLYHVPGFHLIVLVVTLVMAFTMVSRIERMAVGTARAMEMGEIEGAMSSLSIVVAGLLTVIGASVFAQFW